MVRVRVWVSVNVRVRVINGGSPEWRTHIVCIIAVHAGRTRATLRCAEALHTTVALIDSLSA